MGRHAGDLCRPGGDLPVSERIRVSIPSQVEGVDISAHNPDFRQYLVTEAEEAMNKKAKERGRKISERPTLVDITQSPLVDSVVYFEFEANTQPI